MNEYHIILIILPVPSQPHFLVLISSHSSQMYTTDGDDDGNGVVETAEDSSATDAGELW